MPAPGFWGDRRARDSYQRSNTLTKMLMTALIKRHAAGGVQGLATQYVVAVKGLVLPLFDAAGVLFRDRRPG